MPIPPENHKNSVENPTGAIRLGAIRLSELVQHWFDGECDDSKWIVAQSPAHGSSGRVDFTKACIFPGSFNPLHAAHRRMMQLATTKTGRVGFYELSITNADKAELTVEEVESRVSADFSPGLLLTRLPMFEQKAAAFSGAVFVVGADTIQRINNLKYYSNNQFEFKRSIERMASYGIRFLVFGRDDAGRFLDQKALRLRSDLQTLCDFVPRAEFEMKISSTALRNRRD